MCRGLQARGEKRPPPIESPARRRYAAVYGTPINNPYYLVTFFSCVDGVLDPASSFSWRGDGVLLGVHWHRGMASDLPKAGHRLILWSKMLPYLALALIRMN